MLELPPKQIRLLNILLNESIFPSLKEICAPDMSDYGDREGEDEYMSDYDEVWEQREMFLYSKSIEYLKNNLY